MKLATENTSKGEGKENETSSSSHIQQLQQKVTVLEAQNAALKAAVEDQTHLDGRNADKNKGPIWREIQASKFSTDNSSSLGTGNSEENNKKLKRRVEVLERRLEEKSGLLEAAEGKSNQARDLLARVQKEKELLSRTMKGGSKGNDTKSNSEVNIIKYDERAQHIFALEEEVAKLRRKAELEYPQKLKVLEQESRISNERIRELENNLLEAERDAKMASSGMLLREKDEDSNRRIQSLKQDLEEARSIQRELETKLLQRDSDAMEMRFDLEAGRVEVDRLNRRLEEIDESNKIKAGSSNRKDGTGKPSNTDEKNSKKAGERFKRERDLEGVVEALKSVVEKLKAENDRLRKGAAESVKIAEAEKKARELKSKLNSMQQEMKSLRSRAETGEEASLKLAMKTDALNQTKKQLRAQEEAVRAIKNRMENMESDKMSLERELNRANSRVTSLEKELIGARANAGGSYSYVGDHDQEGNSHVELARLKAVVADQKDVIETLRNQRSISSHNKDSGKDIEAKVKEISKLRKEMDRLQEENQKLMSELSAFDLDFFEEIEDLKFKYAEACRKLEMFEGGSR